MKFDALIKLFRGKPIGVDLGTRTIKGIQLKRKNSYVYVEKFFFHDLSKTSDRFPDESNVAETLKANVELTELKKSWVACSLRDEDVLSMNFNLPAMKKNEMDQAVAHEISEHLNLSPDKLSFDYSVVTQTGTSAADESPIGPSEVEIKAYCVNREIVQSRLKILKEAQLKPASMESDMLAIRAMLEFNGYLDPKKSFAVFDLGESHTTSALIAKNELVFTKSSRTACGSVNKALREKLGMSYLQGEDTKIHYDFNVGAEPSAMDAKVIDETYLDLFREIKDAMDFFSEKAGEGQRVDQLLLVGGGSQIKNIERVFEMFFRIPAVVVNPFRNIEIYKSGAKAQENEQDIGTLGPYMATAVGLALTGIE